MSDSATLEAAPQTSTAGIPQGMPIQRVSLGVLVIQASPFCNINCDYCYLPNRTSTVRMDFDVLRNVMQKVADSGIAEHPFEILWHAGEPLAVPLKWYEEAFEIIDSYEKLRGKVTHTVQTNGTLINDAWCEFFKKHKVNVGVSIDGPEFIHDAHRVNRKGEGSFKKSMAGAKKLKEHGIGFGVVSVISAKSLEHPDEIFNFFVDEEIFGVGFNIEEVEGVNADSSLGIGSEQDAKVHAFLERVYELNKAKGFPLSIREFELARSKIFDPVNGGGSGNVYFNLETNPLSMISVDCYGNFSTYSPELLGQATEKYGTFTFGNLNTGTVFDATQNEAFQKVDADIRAGNKKCSETCEFYEFCDGASPSNKYYENGTFDSAETMHCRHMIQAPLRIVLDDIEQGMGLA